MHVRRDVYILNRQWAAPNVYTSHTQFKTHNYWLIVCRVLGAKVVGATSSEGLLIESRVDVGDRSCVENGTRSPTRPRSSRRSTKR